MAEILYDDILSAVDDLFEQWDPSSAKAMEEVRVPQGKHYWKIDFIWSYSVKVS